METLVIHSPYPVSEMRTSLVMLGVGFAMAVGLGGRILLSVLGKKSETGTGTKRPGWSVERAPTTFNPLDPLGLFRGR